MIVIENPCLLSGLGGTWLAEAVLLLLEGRGMSFARLAESLPEL